MKCAACGTEMPDDATFCQSCGAKAGSTAPASTVAGSGLNSPTGRRDDPEEELWTGGYSAYAMIGHFVGAGLLTVILLIVGLFVWPGWLFIGIGIVVIWIAVLCVLAYRRLNIKYRLTTQRFFHQTGILTRTTNRIEVIQMDDVTYVQTFFERFFGVGTIKVTSSDPTHPILVMPGIGNVQMVSETIDKARRKELTRRGLRIESV